MRRSQEERAKRKKEGKLRPWEKRDDNEKEHKEEMACAETPEAVISARRRFLEAEIEIIGEEWAEEDTRHQEAVERLMTARMKAETQLHAFE